MTTRRHWTRTLSLLCWAIAAVGTLVGIACDIAFASQLMPDASGDETAKIVGVLSLVTAGGFAVLALCFRDLHRRSTLPRGFEVTPAKEP